MGTSVYAGNTPFRAPNSDLTNTLRQITETVRDFALFADIPQEDCERIIALAQQRIFPRGTTISFEGDQARHAILLTSGCLKLSQVGVQGQEVILRVVGPGDSVCPSYTTNYTNCATAVTMERSSALVWEAKVFEAIAQRYPVFRRNITHTLLLLLNEMEERFREVSTVKVGPRLCSELVRLSSRVGKPTDGHVEIAFSRQDLAQLTGTTLFTVSRLLCQWEDQGFVKPERGRVLILNVAALMNLAQSE